MKDTIITISNHENETFYFTIDHCQRTFEKDDDVPCTHHLPSNAAPRKGLEDGIVKNKADLITVFYSDYTEIKNPDPDYQA